MVEVGPSGLLRARYEARVEVDAGGRLVTPGLVDPHTHAVFAGSREFELEMKVAGASYEEILAAGGGIYRTVEETRRTPPGELARLAAERLRVMLSQGTTLVEVKTGYGLLPEYELAMLDAIALLRRWREPLPTVVATLLAHVPPREVPRGEYVRVFAERLVPEAARHPARPRYVDVFCDRGAFTPGETRVILEAGLRAGMRLRLHAEELAYIGCSDLAGALPIDSLDHLEYLPPGNARLLAEKGAAATLLPTSMLAVFAEKRPPVEALREAGAPIALATDYNPNNMNPSLACTVDLSVYLLRLTPLEALAAATANAAYSLRLHGAHGSLSLGARGDLVVWDAPGYKWVGYEWGRDKALLVALAGEPVVDRLGVSL